MKKKDDTYNVSVDGITLDKRITRRSVLKTGTLLGASSLLAGGGLDLLGKVAFAKTQPDIAVVQGNDNYLNAIRAVEMLGGMGRFVSSGDMVGILVNSGQDHPGTYVKPEIVLAMVNMCFEAGARDVGLFKSTGRSYWRRTSLSKQYEDAIDALGHIGGDYTTVSIPDGRSLKKAEVSGALLERDVFINIPIAKDHTAVRFTGTMKNMMGLTSSSTNRFFHFGSGSSGWYDDVDFLSQCIADVNLVRRPDLAVFDGSEVVTTNGPSGPGKILRPNKVFAGTDAVALDVYGANLLGLDGRDILATRMASEHGLGQLDLSKVVIQEEVL
jgi:uncharacterized protein (DUF362 family)